MDYSQQIALLENRHRAILQRRISLYCQRLRALESLYDILPRGKKRAQTIPSVFRRWYDENFLTDYLAYILDPSRNGIGPEPLRSVLELSGMDTSSLDFKRVEINREYVLSSGGRIDLCVTVDESLVLGIENKLRSPEGANQTRGYARAIQRDFPDYEHCFVFLTPGGRRASSQDFIAVSYSDLVEALKKVPVRLGNDLRSYFYWEDFIVHVEEYIIMKRGQVELSDKTKLYLEHYSMLSDLESAYQEDLREFFRFLGSMVQESLQGKGWIVDFRPGRGYQQIYRDDWNLPHLWIHFEYVFSKDILLDESFVLMIDVERKTNRRLIELFETYSKRAHSHYEKAGLEYCPKRRSIAIAWKEYPLEIDVTDLSPVVAQLISALEEFSFLPALIDDALAEFDA